LIGVPLGEGIFVSYVFTLLWIAEVILMWSLPKWYDNRPRWLYWSVSVFMAFIAFNGAVVFEDGITRPLGIAATLGLSSLGFFAWREQARRNLPPFAKEAESPGETLPEGSHGVEGDGAQPVSGDSAPQVAMDENATGTNSN